MVFLSINGMKLKSGYDEFNAKNIVPIYPSGEEKLDLLLKGGFRQDLLYLVYGDLKIITDILLRLSVASFKKYGFKEKVVFIDGNNRFNPYRVSSLAATWGLSPKKVLDHIFISRAFTYEQMIETLENNLNELENSEKIRIVLVSGITTLWPDYEKKTFEELLKAIAGIKRTISKSNPLIILTAPLHENSRTKPVGGTALTHFGSVLILIEDKERYIEYKLIQHPSLPENRLIKRTPLKPKRGLKISPKNRTLDKWV
ncbi:hypothetical protein LCGC14_0847780 [marine sediment metagenome]|uniref:Rad51-like C-terminal domain-containing protein n=1 Tax=marine sediment metagenome TaxID=412755 RepID=A0A0F9SIB3_9ZZZZ|nr:hypothetical protein [archaeon]